MFTRSNQISPDLDGSLKSRIKTKHPTTYNILRKTRAIFLMLARQPRELLEQWHYFLKWRHYRSCLRHNRPYFGPILLANQTCEARKSHMEKLVEMETSKLNGSPYKILEIGSWAGGSAFLWAEAIKRFYGGNGVILCVDPWKPYINPDLNVGISQGPNEMEKVLRDGKIYNLFLHNIAAGGHEDIVKPCKGESDTILPTLRDKGFNLVFIDGNHSYFQVIKDLKNSGRLVCEGGVLCGDDLDLQRHEVDIEHAKRERARDFITDTRSNKNFHPGVILAVAEFFGGEVSNFNGFWAMRKTGAKWRKVELS